MLNAVLLTMKTHDSDHRKKKEDNNPFTSSSFHKPAASKLEKKAFVLLIACCQKLCFSDIASRIIKILTLFLFMLLVGDFRKFTKASS